MLSLLRRFLTSTMTQKINTFVFLDLETTGLPHMEHNRTKITEMCAVAVQADHIELGCFPRVHNKLSFCFNPNKLIHPDSSDITGLNNELLERQTSFTVEIVDVLVKWLEASKGPICMVAHNGNRFDYPILRAEVENAGGTLPEDLLCIDSLMAFREIEQREEVKEEAPFEFNDDYDEILCKACDDYEESITKDLSPEEVQKKNETTPKKQIITRGMRPNGCSNRKNPNKQRVFTSYKLPDVYSRLTNKQPINVHEAEGDVLMLLSCAAELGEKFVDYANENCRCFCEIPPMRPGKKIGM